MSCFVSIIFFIFFRNFIALLPLSPLTPSSSCCFREQYRTFTIGEPNHQGEGFHFTFLLCFFFVQFFYSNGFLLELLIAF